jgi:hypothetical protein
MNKEGSPDAWGEASLTFEEETIEAVRASWWGERGWAWSEPEDPVVNTWVWSDQAAQAKLELRLIPSAPEAPDSTATTGGGASAILDQLQKASGFVVDAGTVNLVKGLQSLAIPMRHGDDFLEPGTYTVVLVTIPDDENPRREATTRLTLEADD